MCVDIFIHNTSYAHESRWASEINTSTRWTVYSPFQEPYLRCCATPCIRGPIAPEYRCPWHGQCCALERVYRRCPFYDHSANLTPCSRPTTILHLYQAGGADGNEVARIPPYYVEHLLSCDPLLLSLQNQLFNAGAELVLARKLLARATRRLQELQSAGLASLSPLLLSPTPTPSPSPSPFSSTTTQVGARAEQEYVRCARIVQAALAYVGELSRYWDFKGLTAGPPACPAENDFTPRPGRAVDPRHNLRNCEDTMFRVHSWAGPDPGPIPFPNAITMRPGDEFERIVKKFSHNAHLIPWAKAMPVVNGNTILPSSFS